MHVLIIGGGGFIGSRLANYLLESGEVSLNGQMAPVKRLVLVDKHFPSPIRHSPILEKVEDDFSSESVLKKLFASPPDLVFHLAAIVSGEAEKDFDLGMKINLYATLQLLESCRAAQNDPVIIFSSTCAVFGGDPSDSVKDDTATLPRSSYGTEKAVAELLINDYSRRGFVDGRTVRLPTIVVRPGAPNAATSSFASSVIREPLQGKPAVCPVDPDTRIYILSPGKLIKNLLHAASLKKESWKNNRIITLPGMTVSVREMVRALEDIAGSEISKLIRWEPDKFIQSIVLTWPTRFETTRAEEMGFEADQDFRDIILAFQKELLTTSN